ncbi:SRPBCC family protein [Streptomyces sp. NPDC058373]|uniref:SRPBCC family protein n=1 Tax=Streptomyces sp. NPDC058373 TaxID=3346465 RepID=UPI00364CEB90
MDLNHYRFHSRWELPAAPDAVYRVLEDVSGYPRWWRQVRGVRRVSETEGVLRFRSLLPYDLNVTARLRRQDPAARLLEAALDGDLLGTLVWRVDALAGGARVDFDQAVVVTPRLMRLLAVPGRPLFRANHALMMRSGRAGLARLLGEG